MVKILGVPVGDHGWCVGRRLVHVQVTEILLNQCQRRGILHSIQVSEESTVDCCGSCISFSSWVNMNNSVSVALLIMKGVEGQGGESRLSRVPTSVMMVII